MLGQTPPPSGQIVICGSPSVLKQDF